MGLAGVPLSWYLLVVIPTLPTHSPSVLSIAHGYVPISTCTFMVVVPGPILKGLDKAYFTMLQQGSPWGPPMGLLNPSPEQSWEAPYIACPLVPVHPLQPMNPGRTLS